MGRLVHVVMMRKCILVKSREKLKETKKNENMGKFIKKNKIEVGEYAICIIGLGRQYLTNDWNWLAKTCVQFLPLYHFLSTF